MRKGGYFMKESCKKIFAIFFAAVLILSNDLTILAAGSAPVGMGGAPRNSGSGGIEGIISKTVFHVVLPVIPEQDVESGKPQFTTYDFVLDPFRNLPEEDPDKNYEPDATLFFGNTEPNASYDYSHTSDALTIKNKSTMDVNVELKAELSGLSNIRLTNDSQFKDNRSASVYLALADSRKKTAAIDKYGAYFQTVLTGRPNAYHTVYDSASGRYDYVLKSDSQLLAENIKFPEYSYRLTGACNTKNSWSNLGNPQPEIRVTWIVSPRGTDLSPSIGKTSYTMEKGRPVSIEVDLGSGNLAAKGIKEIKYRNSSGVATLQPTNYTLTNGTLTIKDSYISDVIAVGALSRDYEITFDDNAGTKETITLTADNVSAPSIDQKEYTLVSGKDVLISVDLGSGEFGATGITSITYENASGNASTLPSDKYTFENGVLKIYGSYIKDVIEAGAKRREYTITFNDKASTKETIVFLVEGTAPSIAQLSYTMQKGSDIVVDTDLGSGYLEASDIDSIVYENSAGVATLSKNNYTFTGGKLTIKSAYITDVIEVGVKSRDYTIIFNNVAKTRVTITLTAPDVAPSIQQTSYKMVSGKDILINVDLGAGDWRATGIESITYTKETGPAILSTSNYALANGVLTIKGAYIKDVLEAGVDSRNYTIKFNDIAKTEETIELTADGVFPSIAQTSYSMQRGTDIKVNVDLGSGNLRANSISSIIYTVNPGETRTLATGNYSFSNGVLTICGAYITDVIEVGVKSRDYTIIFDNVAKTKATITLTAPDVAPSIQQTTYSMVSGKDILINVDLGSGDWRATGIQSINYRNERGPATLSTGNYSLANGVLTIKGSYISDVLEVGVASRDYTIKFNDPAGTEKIVTFAANGTFPSIAQTTYSMQRGTDIRMNVNLGSGDLQARSIRSITYVMSSGEVRTLATGNYSFSGGILSIKGGYITDVINTGTTSRDYTILFDNVAKTKVKVTLTAVNKAPSVARTSYTMVSNQALSINLDMGSGNLMATGIRRITYVNNVGVLSALATANYTVSNGVLTIRGSYITDVLNTGAASRDYTITFNDAAATTVKITLTR